MCKQSKTVNQMKISIDSDKNGTELKKMLIAFLHEKKFSITDLNYLETHEGDDYPDVAVNLAKSIKDKVFDRGILICGTGQEMAMRANNVEGVFAGVQVLKIKFSKSHLPDMVYI